MPRASTVTKFLRYEFSAEELQAKGKELAEQHDKRARLEEEFEAVKADYKERSLCATREIGRLSRLIKGRFDMRAVECRYDWNFPECRASS